MLYTERDLDEIKAARDLLLRNNMRDNVGYWILLHAYNRAELGHDDMFLRVGRSSRDAVRKLRLVGAS